MKKLASIILTFSIVMATFLNSFIYAKQKKVYVQCLTSKELATVYVYNEKLEEVCRKLTESGIDNQELERFIGTITTITDATSAISDGVATATNTLRPDISLIATVCARATQGLSKVLRDIEMNKPPTANARDMRDKVGAGAKGGVLGGAAGGIFGAAIGGTLGFIVGGPVGAAVGISAGAVIAGVPSGAVAGYASAKSMVKGKENEYERRIKMLLDRQFDIIPSPKTLDGVDREYVETHASLLAITDTNLPDPSLPDFYNSYK